MQWTFIFHLIASLLPSLPLLYDHSMHNFWYLTIPSNQLYSHQFESKNILFNIKYTQAIFSTPDWKVEKELNYNMGISGNFMPPKDFYHILKFTRLPTRLPIFAPRSAVNLRSFHLKHTWGNIFCRRYLCGSWCYNGIVGLCHYCIVKSDITGHYANKEGMLMLINCHLKLRNYFNETLQNIASSYNISMRHEKEVV